MRTCIVSGLPGVLETLTGYASHEPHFGQTIGIGGIPEGLSGMRKTLPRQLSPVVKSRAREQPAIGARACRRGVLSAPSTQARAARLADYYSASEDGGGK